MSVTNLTVIMLTNTFDLHAKAAGLDLEAFLKERRGQYPPASLADIARELDDLGVHVSQMTLSRWCKQRGIQPSRPRAARQPRTPDAPSDPIEGEARLVPAAATPPETTAPESAYDRELRMAREQR